MIKKPDISTPPKVSIVTLGCPMNQVDSGKILSGLASYGFEIASEEEADVIIVNTCGFIGSAREESIETIISINDYRKKGNMKALVVAGCLAERYREELERDLTEADAIVGLSDAARIPEICSNLLKYTTLSHKNGAKAIIGSRLMSYLKIAEGCDNRCSYCAIPIIRGNFRSIPEEEVLQEAEHLADFGIKEIVVIGQDTTNYGNDLDGKNLSGLLEKISRINGIEWIRLLYAHPAHINDTIIESFTNIPKLLPYIDIPIQHISADILKNMGRKTPPDEIKRILDRLREKIPGIVIRTSLIVGFPGETEKDFTELINFVENYRFERLGAFIYSPEDGTRAALLKNNVTEDIANERYVALMEFQGAVSEKFHKSLIGKEFDMIIDGIEPDTGEAFGRTYMDAPEIDGNVFVSAGVEEKDTFRRIKIIGADSYDLKGEVLP
jgi:ribosomal protein S12 methylthiotransferase